MKAQILKIAGVKSEEEFYKKYPSEESFMKVHGKAFKKALNGDMLSPRGGYLKPDDSLKHMDLYTGTDDTPQNNFIGESYGPYNAADPNVVTDNSGSPTKPKSPKGGIGDAFSKFSGPVSDLVKGFQALSGEKQELKSAQQWRDVSDVTLQASRTRPEQEQRRYVRPEDMTTTGEELFPIYGRGTNVLGKNGVAIPEASGGFMAALDQFGMEGGSDMASQFITGIGGRNAGGDIGGTIGSTVGGMFGPAGKVIGQVGGQVIGGLLDRNPARTRKANAVTQQNVQNMSLNNTGQEIQGQYEEYMEYGGDIPTDQNLQTYWGGYAEPLSNNKYLPEDGQTVMFRGQSHDDSDGKGNTGIGVTYGNNPVEVERGEPAVKLPDSNGNNLVVFGNLQIPKEFVPLLDDPKAKGRKFKSYVADLSKTETRQNNILGKATSKLDDMDIVTSMDKLTLASEKANVLGANMKLKIIADKKERAGRLQNAMNETAEEMGISAEHLAKGKIKQAKKGITIPIAKDGYKDLINKAFSKEKGFTDEEREKAYQVMRDESGGNPNITNINNDEKHSKDVGLYQINDLYHPEVHSGGNVYDPVYNINSAADIALDSKKHGKGTFSQWTSTRNSPHTPVSSELPYDGIQGEALAPMSRKEGLLPQAPLSDQLAPTKGQTTRRGDGSNLMNIYNQILPLIRPSNKQTLNPNQLAGEMYALSNNQVEPVQAQDYQPQLDTPYDISLQDIRNENTADYRASQRMVTGNPTMQAILNAQKYEANQKVGAEEFRMNQAEKDKVYSKNRDILNDAKLKNLSINDQQYTRQAEAKSNTKSTIQAALNSISDKYAKNSLENKTLQVYENLYNYRYDNQGRAINMNGLNKFNTEINTATNANGLTNLEQAESTYKYLHQKEQEKIKGAMPSTKTKSKNGLIVRALKNI